LQGDAEHLSQYLPENSVDYLIDVKSSFFYPDKDAFFREAAKVLKDDGLFFISIVNFRTHLEQVHRDIKRHFMILVEEDVTDNALRSLHLDSDRIQRFIDERFPVGLRSLMK
jgi:SAM-dependent methyltransferase